MRRATALLAFLALCGHAHADGLSVDDVDALGRVTWAEAGNQPLEGRCAVVETILHRLASGRWGGTVQSVVSAPHQFEPVTRAGSWRELPALSTEQRAELSTILRLRGTGLLADASGGADHFQNERLVADRAGPVGFSGMPVAAIVGSHTFYRSAEAMAAPSARPKRALQSMLVGGDDEPDVDDGKTVFTVLGK